MQEGRAIKEVLFYTGVVPEVFRNHFLNGASIDIDKFISDEHQLGSRSFSNHNKMLTELVRDANEKLYNDHLSLEEMRSFRNVLHKNISEVTDILLNTYGYDDDLEALAFVTEFEVIYAEGEPDKVNIGLNTRIRQLYKEMIGVLQDKMRWLQDRISTTEASTPSANPESGKKNKYAFVSKISDQVDRINYLYYSGLFEDMIQAQEIKNNDEPRLTKKSIAIIVSRLMNLSRWGTTYGYFTKIMEPIETIQREPLRLNLKNDYDRKKAVEKVENQQKEDNHPRYSLESLKRVFRALSEDGFNIEKIKTDIEKLTNR